MVRSRAAARSQCYDRFWHDQTFIGADVIDRGLVDFRHPRAGRETQFRPLSDRCPPLRSSRLFISISEWWQGLFGEAASSSTPLPLVKFLLD